ncbi:hypothetical protein ACN27G_19895 [Plantactinospora sp. WMMB334]|uniref:hypothetical protein n=1 Tax=Plantactinospora sp. WMMB334 TaxID=3404119 RepID=UPI003B95E0BC
MSAAEEETRQLSPSEAEIRALLADPDEALRRWYAQYLAAEEEPDLILAGGGRPGQLGEFFDGWLKESRDRLRVVLCERLRYARFSERGKQLGEVALVGLVATLLTDVAAELVIDPLSTAAVLVIRRQLDTICPPGAATPS